MSGSEAGGSLATAADDGPQRMRAWWVGTLPPCPWHRNAALLLPGNAGLDDVAFGLLGNWGERSLALGIDAWFVGLLVLGTHGWTRIVGWVIVSILTTYHLVSSVGAIFSITVPSFGVFSFLPLFVYLLIEGAKRGGQAGLGPQRPDSEHVEDPAT